MLPLAEEFSRKLVAAKAKALVTRPEAQRAAIRLEMEVMDHQYLANIQTVLAGQAELLQRAGMPLDLTVELTRDWIRNFISGRSLELTRRATPTLVDRLPDSVRLFYGYGPQVSPNDQPAP